MIGSGSRSTPRCRRARRSPGFSLLEVMVALALLAGALMAIAELSGQALRNHAYARDLSEATLLARGKMIELEQKYEDEGFRDFDEREEGTFEDQGRPDMRWRVEVLRPRTDLTPEGILTALTGAEDANAALAALIGTQEVPGSDGDTTVQSPLAGLAGGLVQTQITAFAETLEKSLREMRLTVSWDDGKVPRDLTVSTHLVVLNPRAPGGARGDDPDVPPNIAAPLAGTGGAPGTAGVPAIPGVTGTAVQPGTSPFVRPQGDFPFKSRRKRRSSEE